MDTIVYEDKQYAGKQSWSITSNKGHKQTITAIKKLYQVANAVGDKNIVYQTEK